MNQQTKNQWIIDTPKIKLSAKYSRDDIGQQFAQVGYQNRATSQSRICQPKIQSVYQVQQQQIVARRSPSQQNRYGQVDQQHSSILPQRSVTPVLITRKQKIQSVQAHLHYHNRNNSQVVVQQQSQTTQLRRNSSFLRHNDSPNCNFSIIQENDAIPPDVEIQEEPLEFHSLAFLDYYMPLILNKSVFLLTAGNNFIDLEQELPDAKYVLLSLIDSVELDAFTNQRFQTEEISSKILNEYLNLVLVRPKFSCSLTPVSAGVLALRQQFSDSVSKFRPLFPLFLKFERRGHSPQQIERDLPKSRLSAHSPSGQTQHRQSQGKRDGSALYQSQVNRRSTCASPGRVEQFLPYEQQSPQAPEQWNVFIQFVRKNRLYPDTKFKTLEKSVATSYCWVDQDQQIHGIRVKITNDNNCFFGFYNADIELNYQVELGDCRKVAISPDFSTIQSKHTKIVVNIQQFQASIIQFSRNEQVCLFKRIDNAEYYLKQVLANGNKLLAIIKDGTIQEEIFKRF